MTPLQRQQELQRIKQSIVLLPQKSRDEQIQSLSSAVSFLLEEVARLNNENQLLRQEITRLNNENQNLREENARLRGGGSTGGMSGGIGGMTGGTYPRYAGPSSCRTEAMLFSSLIPFF